MRDVCACVCVCVGECACTLGSAAHEMQIDDDCQGFSCGFDELPAFSPLSLLEMLVNSNVLATLLPRCGMGVCAECVSGCVCVSGLVVYACWHRFTFSPAASIFNALAVGFSGTENCSTYGTTYSYRQ